MPCARTPLVARLVCGAVAPLALAVVAATARAQQPFVTDDAEVTARGKLHLELADEFDVLQTESLPTLSQNRARASLAYGVAPNVEVSVDVPLLTIFNDASVRSPRPTGLADMGASVKVKLRGEREGSHLPALAASVFVELPTGDVTRQLGSGIEDYGLNLVGQKTLTERTTLRANAGAIFSGNTVSGALGIRERGLVFTGAASLVRRVSPRLQLGVEGAGALTREFALSKGQLQAQVGGNYALSDKITLDFGFLAGRFVASPRAGVLLGLSIDF
jgi:hypothetical protein